jgi:hypothetical protein
VLSTAARASHITVEESGTEEEGSQEEEIVPVRRATKISGEQVSRNMPCRIGGSYNDGCKKLYFFDVTSCSTI